MALALTPNFEVTRLIDNGFDAQHNAELVVHFEPVAFDAMLDAGARQTIGFGCNCPFYSRFGRFLRAFERFSAVNGVEGS